MSLFGASLPDLIGYLGVSLILIAYFLLQIGRLNTEKPLYSALNGLGAVAILVSLYYNPNWPSIIIEIAWLIISLFGLFQSIKHLPAKTGSTF